jgi:hypothetical protein
MGVGVGQADAEVDDPPPPGGVGDQAGVVGGVGHGGYGLDQGVEEGPATHIDQVPAVVQLPQHGDWVGWLVMVSQAQDGSPDRPVGGPVEVGLLEHAGDLGQEASGGQDRPEDGLFGFQVVGWLPVRVGHWPQPPPGRQPAWLDSGHRRGVRAPLPRRLGRGTGLRWSRMCLT